MQILVYFKGGFVKGMVAPGIRFSTRSVIDLDDLHRWLDDDGR